MEGLESTIVHLGEGEDLPFQQQWVIGLAPQLGLTFPRHPAATEQPPLASGKLSG